MTEPTLEMDGLFILEGDTPVPCRDALAWARWKAHHPDLCRVALDVLTGPAGEEIKVSTVFLAMDLGAEDPPVLWETMVRGGDGPLDGRMWRYTTRGWAEEGHRAVVAALRSTLGASPPPAKDAPRSPEVEAVIARQRDAAMTLPQATRQNFLDRMRAGEKLGDAQRANGMTLDQAMGTMDLNIVDTPEGKRLRTTSP